MNNIGCNSCREYEKLDTESKELLLNWIATHFLPSNRKMSASSYTIKHIFTRETELYVNNGQFKGAMLMMGFYPVDKSLMNWKYKAEYIPSAATESANL